LPIAREIAAAYVADETKLPWYIDLLNANLGNDDLDLAKARITELLRSLSEDGSRITENLDFDA